MKEYNNPIVETFIKEVNDTIKTYYETHLPNLKPVTISLKVGRKFIKLLSNGGVWGFISRYDGDYKGVPIKKGDLMKAASRNSPSKHSRGNIVDGTAKWSIYGPDYLK